MDHAELLQETLEGLNIPDAYEGQSYFLVPGEWTQSGNTELMSADEVYDQDWAHCREEFQWVGRFESREQAISELGWNE